MQAPQEVELKYMQDSEQKHSEKQNQCSVEVSDQVLDDMEAGIAGESPEEGHHMAGEGAYSTKVDPSGGDGEAKKPAEGDEEEEEKPVTPANVHDILPFCCCCYAWSGAGGLTPAETMPELFCSIDLMYMCGILGVFRMCGKMLMPKFRRPVAGTTPFPPWLTMSQLEPETQPYPGCYPCRSEVDMYPWIPKMIDDPNDTRTAEEKKKEGERKIPNPMRKPEHSEFYPTGWCKGSKYCLQCELKCKECKEKCKKPPPPPPPRPPTPPPEPEIPEPEVEVEPPPPPGGCKRKCDKKKEECCEACEMKKLACKAWCWVTFKCEIVCYYFWCRCLIPPFNWCKFKIGGCIMCVKLFCTPWGIQASCNPNGCIRFAVDCHERCPCLPCCTPPTPPTAGAPSVGGGLCYACCGDYGFVAPDGSIDPPRAGCCGAPGMKGGCCVGDGACCSASGMCKCFNLCGCMTTAGCCVDPITLKGGCCGNGWCCGFVVPMAPGCQCNFGCFKYCMMGCCMKCGLWCGAKCGCDVVLCEGACLACQGKGGGCFSCCKQVTCGVCLPGCGAKMGCKKQCDAICAVCKPKPKGVKGPKPGICGSTDMPSKTCKGEGSCCAGPAPAGRGGADNDNAKKGQCACIAACCQSCCTIPLPPPRPDGKVPHVDQCVCMHPKGCCVTPVAPGLEGDFGLGVKGGCCGGGYCCGFLLPPRASCFTCCKTVCCQFMATCGVGCAAKCGCDVEVCKASCGIGLAKPKKPSCGVCIKGCMGQFCLGAGAKCGLKAKCEVCCGPPKITPPGMPKPPSCSETCDKKCQAIPICAKMGCSCTCFSNACMICVGGCLGPCAAGLGACCGSCLHCCCYHRYMGMILPGGKDTNLKFPEIRRPYKETEASQDPYANPGDRMDKCVHDTDTMTWNGMPVPYSKQAYPPEWQGVFIEGKVIKVEMALHGEAKREKDKYGEPKFRPGDKKYPHKKVHAFGDFNHMVRDPDAPIVAPRHLKAVPDWMLNEAENLELMPTKPTKKKPDGVPGFPHEAFPEELRTDFLEYDHTDNKCVAKGLPEKDVERNHDKSKWNKEAMEKKGKILIELGYKKMMEDDLALWQKYDADYNDFMQGSSDKKPMPPKINRPKGMEKPPCPEKPM